MTKIRKDYTGLMDVVSARRYAGLLLEGLREIQERGGHKLKYEWLTPRGGFLVRAGGLFRSPLVAPITIHTNVLRTDEPDSAPIEVHVFRNGRLMVAPDGEYMNSRRILSLIAAQVGRSCLAPEWPPKANTLKRIRSGVGAFKLRY